MYVNIQFEKSNVDIHTLTVVRPSVTCTATSTTTTTTTSASQPAAKTSPITSETRVVRVGEKKQADGKPLSCAAFVVAR